MDLDKLKVVDLRKELQDRGLDTKGVKAVLVKRLKLVLDREAQEAGTKVPSQDSPQKDPGDADDKPAEVKEVASPTKVEVASPIKQDPQTPKREPVKTAAEKKESPVAQQSPQKPEVKVDMPSPVKAVSPAKAASPVKATSPIKAASPVKAASPIKAASPVKAASPIKAASPVKATSPIKEASPIKEVSPIKEASPTKAETEEEEKVQEVKSEQMEVETEGDQPTSNADETEAKGEKRKRDEEEDEQDEAQAAPTDKRKRRKKNDSTIAVEQTPETEAKRGPPKEDEPEIDYQKTQLSWYDSDLNLKIDKTNFLSAKPYHDGCFGYVWAGARANHGISSGKICYEVKLTEELKWEDLAGRIKDRENHKKDLKQEDKNKAGENKEMETEENGEKVDAAMDVSEVPTEEKTEDDKMESKEDDKQQTEVEEDAAKEEDKANEEEEEKPKEVEDKANEEEEDKPKEEEIVKASIPTHYFRVGFSLKGTSLQLGECKYSYAYESTGKFLTNKEFQDYGVTFGIGDVIGAYLSIDDNDVSITFAVNGVAQPTITISRTEIVDVENLVLFPHVLCRNYAFEVNYGAQEEPWFAVPEDLKEYQFLQSFDGKVDGPRRPEKREDCEALLMIGLPGSGKTHWVNNHIANNPEKQYTVIGNKPIFDRMTVEAEPMRTRFPGSWKILVDRMQKCLNQLTDQACARRRNFIIDQTNVFPNAQRRKLRGFEGFKRKAIVVVCEDEEHKRRQTDQQNDYGKIVPESTMYDLKAQFELPQKTDQWIEEIVYSDLQEEEAVQKVKQYNEDANKKGYFKRKFPQRNNRFQPIRNFRGRRGGGNFRQIREARPNWNRPHASWGNAQQNPRPQQGYGSFRARGNPQNRRDGGYNRNQGGARNAAWQGGGSWGGGNNQRGWNASMYGNQGYGAWNQATQQYGNQGAQAQRGYGYNQGGYGQSYNQGYNTTGYGTGTQNYGGQGQGYGPQNWNWSYAQYNQQQQGWGSNAQQTKRK